MIPGIDETGEPVNSGMYENLWCNTPREVHEYPDYSHEEHFGKNLPSFIPRQLMYDYVVGKFRHAFLLQIKNPSLFYGIQTAYGQ